MRIVLTSIVLLLLTSTLSAQTNNVAPVNWERYKLRDERVSVMLPKMPTVNTIEDVCFDTKRTSYFSYADGVVYEVVMASEIPARFGEVYCRETGKFRKEGLARRINELNSARGQTPLLGKSGFQGLEVVVLTTDHSVRWLIADTKKNQRWVEMAAHYYPHSKPEITEFMNSLKLDNSAGKDIGEGLPQMLGDPIAGAPVGSPPTNAVITPYRVISKPRTKYTKKARSKNITGTVTLTAEFLSNGSTGEVRVIRSLPEGLDEEAINAARKIAFLPKRVNGVAVDTRVTIEYGFTIY